MGTLHKQQKYLLVYAMSFFALLTIVATVLFYQQDLTWHSKPFFCPDNTLDLNNLF